VYVFAEVLVQVEGGEKREEKEVALSLL